MLDNAVVFLLPVYIVFEVCWLITGTVWVIGTTGVEDPSKCDHTVYIFSLVVMVNFWIHIWDGIHQLIEVILRFPTFVN